MQTLLKKNSCLSLTFSQSNGQAFQDNYRVLLEEKEEKIVFRPNDLVKVLNTASFGLIFNGDIEMAWPCNAKVQCIHFYNSFWNHLKTQRTHLFSKKTKIEKGYLHKNYQDVEIQDSLHVEWTKQKVFHVIFHSDFRGNTESV